jgi:HEPN domain-containing protein
MDNPKIKLVRSWLNKARHDLGSAKRLAGEPAALLDTAIYHCQQAAEKSLKAYLVYRDVRFDKVHNLTALLEYCSDLDPAFREFSDAAANLTPYATAFRYPDEFFEEEPSKAEYDVALQQAASLLAFVSSVLPKDAQP